jgi:hypothetical protein
MRPGAQNHGAAKHGARAVRDRNVARATFSRAVHPVMESHLFVENPVMEIGLFHDRIFHS